MYKLPINKTRLSKPKIVPTLVGTILGLLISFSFLQGNVSAQSTLCGSGSPPDYGLNYPLEQFHWTVGWEGYASEQTIDDVDLILDQLNEDSIAQTMILIEPREKVGIPTNCAVHFLRYMQLGFPTGERKDNGFVFLIVVNQDSIDVHYAVGLGLPALTAYELTSINRAVEATYVSTSNMDEALQTLVQEFDIVARNNYQPLMNPVSTQDASDLPAGAVALSTICAQLCMGIFIFLFLFWMFSQMGHGGGTMFGPYGGSGSGGGFRGLPHISGRSSGPRMRSGGGSGRSGRTN